MEEFLQSLTPALAGVVRDAVEEVGQDRLVQTASLYTHDIDSTQTWPTERFTAEMVALQFIRDVRPVVSPAIASGIDAALGRRTTASAGTGAALVGVAAAGGVYGGQKAMLAMTSKLVQRQYEEIDLDYTSYRNLVQSIIAGALRNTTNRANWNLIGSAFAQVGFDPTTWENQVAARYQNELLSNLVGILARAAWTGQKRTLDQLPTGTILPDFESSVGQWARNHVERVVYNQNLMSHRVVRGIVNRLQEQGAGPQTIIGRLKKMWGLSPRDALAVENYREMLADQGKKVGMVNRLADAYVDRLMKQRISLLARTETMNSINMGKQLMWERAMHEGNLPIDIMKVWVTAADEAVCPVCRPMDRVKVPLTSMFTTSSGKVLMPPVHPRCRCIAMLVEPEIADLGDYAAVITEPSTSPVDILVGKHFGGPSGKEDHPITGTPQTIHNKGGEGGESKGIPDWAKMGGVAGLVALGVTSAVLLRGPRLWMVPSANTFDEAIDVTRALSSRSGMPDWIRQFNGEIGDLSDNYRRSSFTQGALRRDLLDSLQRNTYEGTLRSVEQAIKNKKVEFGFYIDDQGRILGGFRGMPDYVNVPFPQNVSVAERARITMTHNHPGKSTPISGGDVLAHIKSGMKETRAVSRDGTISSMKTTGSPSKSDLYLKLAEASKRIEEGITTAERQMNLRRGDSLVDKDLAKYNSIVHYSWKWFADIADGISYELTGALAGVAKSMSDLIKHMGGSSGKDPHPSGSPQEVHSIRTFKSSIRTLKSGDITMFPTKELDASTEGYGFRFGNTERIMGMANAMLRGEDLFTREGKTQPIMVMVYRDGQRVFDGKHRLAAARLIGREEVPVQVARVNRKMPEPRTLRERWDERRRQKYRERLANQPSGTVAHEQKVRELSQIQERFNRRMEERSRRADEKMFADLGITRGEGRWVAIKKDNSATPQSV